MLSKYIRKSVLWISFTNKYAKAFAYIYVLMILLFGDPILIQLAWVSAGKATRRRIDAQYIIIHILARTLDVPSRGPSFIYCFKYFVVSKRSVNYHRLPSAQQRPPSTTWLVIHHNILHINSIIKYIQKS